ncbi:Chaperone for protein-folding within the ER, fungal [Rhizoctonia solani]|uniref:Chaperone for protein-folding within the ER, fungal n=1 Tax=Rhizoctonia solani TaxID=456999 RepID=A0A8H7LGB6_9AGAM|nr:Chaperone for protein-folding within the ER, fungal [Rhizoctonia solani]
MVLAQDVRLDAGHNVTSLRVCVEIYTLDDLAHWGEETKYFERIVFLVSPRVRAPSILVQQLSEHDPLRPSTDDGFWEQCIYRLVSHGTSSCTKGVTIYQHGTYQHQPDGSIILSPFWQDGRIQILDPCTSSNGNQISVVNQTEHIRSWRIFDGPVLRLVGEYYTPTENMTRVDEQPELLTGVVSNIS